MFKIRPDFQFSKILIALLITFVVICKTAAVAHSSGHVFKNLISENSSNHEQCEICDGLNLQNQTLTTANFIVVLGSFILLILIRKFDSVKLSYLLSSKSSRAPPVIS